jgi:hypothetical protein
MISFPDILEDFRLAGSSALEKFGALDTYLFLMERFEVYLNLQKELPYMNEVEQVRAKVHFLAEMDALNAYPEARLYSSNALKEVLASDVVQRAGGWVTISKFGAETDKDATVIAIHADMDFAFQKEILAKLENLYPKGETDPRGYAHLYDRVAASYFDLSQRKLQRYGTHGEGRYEDEPGGFRRLVVPWELLPMEDPEHIHERRAAMGLMPLAEYVRLSDDYRKLPPIKLSDLGPR